MSQARTILIADDSAPMREVIRRCCARPGDTILEAANGEETVDIYREHQPDWALIDIQMPVMDGLVATRSIREQFPDAHILIITQSHEAVWGEEARAAGADAFLLKDDLTRLNEILETP